MNRTLSLLPALFVVLGAAACSTNTPSPVAPSSTAVGAADAALDARRSSAPTIVGIATGNPAFTTLVAAVQKAGLVDALSGPRHYTVFAPTNDAFNAAGTALNAALSLGLVDGEGNGLGDELVDALPADTLTAILLYHVTNGDRNSTSVLAAGQLRMLDGNQAVVQGTSIAGAPFVVDLLDLRASNGLVHVISGVMVPPGLL